MIGASLKVLAQLALLLLLAPLVSGFMKTLKAAVRASSSPTARSGSCFPKAW